MTELPFEILRLTSQFVSRSDLLQFQLVNKRWNEASRETLYSKVSIRNERVALSYVRAISNRRELGSYLKYIHVYRLFSEYRNATEWDRHNLLERITKDCFNLRSIEAYSTHPLLWARLLQAANQGQFSNLQVLPSALSEGLEYYVCTALAFRKSLTTLYLGDHLGIPDPTEAINDRAFVELRDRIKEFPNLKFLTIQRCSDQPFSHVVDSLTDDCPHLVQLDVCIRGTGLQASREQDILDIIKPNIRRLSCEWLAIYQDDQLKYVMRKFPNLQYLHTEPTYGGRDKNIDITSYDVLMEFMRYISNIKELDISFDCKRKDIVKYWSEFRKFRKSEDLEELSVWNAVDEDSPMVTMGYNRKKADLLYNINNIDNFFPHEEFLCEHGDKMKRLSINHTYSTYTKLDTTSPLRYKLNHENWIYQILQLCPSLQELELTHLVDLKLPFNGTYQHTKLEKLEIKDFDRITSLKFLRNFSFHVPNFKKLDISNYYDTGPNDGYCIEIDMPYTMLNLFSIKFQTRANEIEDYFIKLNTIDNEQYYFINSTGRRDLTYTEYQNHNKLCRFEITCLGLKQFELKRNDYDDFDIHHEIISEQKF